MQKAEQGDAEAQHMLGLSFSEGWDRLQDYSQAASWYRKAADQGLPRAQCELGVLYHVGKGVRQDHTEAVSLWRQAAEQGLPRAQYNLAGMYFSGQGIVEDLTEAYKWASLAATLAHTDWATRMEIGSLAALRDFEKYYPELRDLIAKKMTPAQIAEAQQRAREWTAAFEQRQKK